MNKSALRIGFAGTPDFAARHLAALLSADLHVVCVYTQPDRPAGRGKQPQASSVKVMALLQNIPVQQPQSLKDEEAQQQIRDLKLDVLVVVAYGLILPKTVLTIPRYGCINVHASLLPRWRGAAPIERAILAGDKQSGITIMQMDAGLDTGEMLLRQSTDIEPDDNSASLTERLIILGQKSLLKVLEQVQSQTLTPEAQDDSLSSYASKLDKEEALIGWHKNAEAIQRQINAWYPRSPAYCFYYDQRLRIIQANSLEESSQENPGTILEISQTGLKISCVNSCLLIKKIQIPGKAETSIKDFLNGRKDFFKLGTQFSIAPINAA